MLSVAVQKDIGEYTEKVALGLSARTLVGIGIGVGVGCVELAVGYFALHVPIENTSVVFMLTVMAGFIAGYAKPLGLPFTKAVPLIVRQRFGENRISYSSSVALYADEAVAAVRADIDGSMDKKEVKHVRKEKQKYVDARSRRGRKSAEVLLAGDRRDA